MVELCKDFSAVCVVQWQHEVGVAEDEEGVGAGWKRCRCICTCKGRGCRRVRRVWSLEISMES